MDGKESLKTDRGVLGLPHDNVHRLQLVRESVTIHDFDRPILVTYIYKLSLDILVFLVVESVLQITIGCGTQDFIFCFYKVHSPMNNNIRKLFYFCFLRVFLCKTQHNNNKTKYSYLFSFLEPSKPKWLNTSFLI